MGADDSLHSEYQRSVIGSGYLVGAAFAWITAAKHGYLRITWPEWQVKSILLVAPLAGLCAGGTPVLRRNPHSHQYCHQA